MAFVLSSKILNPTERALIYKSLSVEQVLETISLASIHPILRKSISGLVLELDSRLKTNPEKFNSIDPYLIFPAMSGYYDRISTEFSTLIAREFFKHKPSNAQEREIYREFIVSSKIFRESEKNKRSLSVKPKWRGDLNLRKTRKKIASVLKAIGVSSSPYSITNSIRMRNPNELSKYQIKLKSIGSGVFSLATADLLYQTFPEWQPDILSLAKKSFYVPESFQSYHSQISARSTGHTFAARQVYMFLGAVFLAHGFKKADMAAKYLVGDSKKLIKTDPRLLCALICVEQGKPLPTGSKISRNGGEAVISIGGQTIVRVKGESSSSVALKKAWKSAYRILSRYASYDWDLIPERSLRTESTRAEDLAGNI